MKTTTAFFRRAHWSAALTIFVLIGTLVLGALVACGPTPTPIAPTATPVPPTATPVLPTATPTPVPPTDTPSPPPTPVPTPTSIPQPEATVATEVLNVRSGPGTNYSKVRQVKEGERLKVIGRTEASDWLQIVTSDGQEGWVSAELVTVNADLGPVAVAQVSPAPISVTETPMPTPVPETPMPTPPSPVAVKSVADDIAAEVGQVTRVVEGDPNRTVIVFEETHSSPAGQVEIATMLNRLHERYGLRHIGLEGHFAADGNLDATWFDDYPPFKAGQPIREREDVIVQLLEDGEISSSEMMALTYYADNVEVAGIENADEYHYHPPDEAWGATTWHLFQIAALGMSPSEIAEFNNLVDDEEIMEAIEFAINTDEWTSNKYALMQDETIIIQAEEWLQIIDDIAAKAVEVGADVDSDDKANLQALRQFFERASDRSRTMVAYTMDLLNQSPNAPVAMIIGAAHTELVAQLFAEKGVSVAVIRGNSLEENRKEGDLHYQAYERKSNSLSVDPAGALAALLDGRKKPQPVIGEIWFQSKANIYLLTDLLARAAAAGEMPLTDTLSKLPSLEGVTLNQDSIRVEEGDVIFGVEALDANGNQVTIWVRARASGEVVEKLLRNRLSEGYTHVQSKEEPSEEPEAETSPPVLTPVSSETVAKFAASEAEIKAAPLG